METTDRGFKKPLGTDMYNVQDSNDNMDKLEEVLDDLDSDIKSKFDTTNAEIGSLKADLTDSSYFLDKVKAVDGRGSGLDADTVRGFTVEKSVPSNAKFTDTNTDTHREIADVVNSTSSIISASLKAVKTAYDKAVSAYAKATSASNILALIKTVDGKNSGLDADTVRGFAVDKAVPSNALFTDTNTQRSISNSVVSTSQSVSASSYAAKITYDRGSLGITKADNAQSTANSGVSKANAAQSKANDAYSKASCVTGSYMGTSDGGYTVALRWQKITLGFKPSAAYAMTISYDTYRGYTTISGLVGKGAEVLTDYDYDAVNRDTVMRILDDGFEIATLGSALALNNKDYKYHYVAFR